ncbi:metallophosphoesterase family protein [Neobacillus pocheonensis]|uniref:metallophosphoesterase family protein n=1 Tax=Neobacillus pocheonensis TaxID=363869 RepID=UPI003D2CDC42
MRKWVMSDIHGQYNAMRKLLEFSNVNYEKDQLIFLGDFIDRGPDSAQVVKYVRDLKIQYPNNVYAIIGNHEVMMREFVFEGKSDRWLRFGGYQTIESLKNAFKMISERDQHLVWLANLGYYCMDEEYLYVHAGIDPVSELNKQYDEVTFIEIDEMYKVPPLDLKEVIGDRIIVHGHTPYPSVYQTENFISCDTGASVLEDGVLSLVELNSKTYYSCELVNFQIKKYEIETKKINERINEYKKNQKK